MEKTILTLEQRFAIEELTKAIKNIYDNGLSIWFDPETSDLVAIDEQNISDMEICYFGEAPSEPMEKLDNPDDFFNNKVSVLPNEISVNQIPDNDTDIWVKYNN